MNLQIGFNEIEIDALSNPNVEAVWTYYNELGNQHHIVPDGRTDLIFTFNMLANDTIDNLTPLLCPPFTKAHSLQIAPHQGFIGIRFRAGTAGTFLGAPPANLKGELQYAQQVARLLPWVTKFSRIHRLNCLITGINQHVCAAPKQASSSMVDDILSLIHLNQGVSTINNIASQINVSERTVARNFTRAVGLSPKQFSSIVRLRRAIASLANPSCSVLAVALDCGFSDQAHMTREIRNYLGKTPLLIQNAPANEFML